MNRRRVAAASSLAAIALLAGACGSSSSSSSPSTPTPASSAGTSAGTTPSSGPGTTAKGSSVAVGTIGSFSGPEASSEAGAKQAVVAWADWTNAHGGLAGHPLKLYVEDDGSNAATALTDAKTLVEQDHVVAIVGEQSNVDTTWASYVEKAGVPVVGGLSIDLPFLTNPDFYPAGTNVLALSYGYLTIAKKLGPKFGELYCAEAPQCAAAGTLLKGLAPALGVQVPVIQSVSATAPNYTAVCQAIKDSGVSSYFIADAVAVDIRVAGACKQQGVTASLIEDDGAVLPSMLTAPGTQGLLGTETDFPFFDASTPATQAYQAALKQYAPNIGTENGPNAAYTWVGGELLVAAVKASGTSTITPASVKAGLYALPKGTTLGGLTPPLTFITGKPSQVNCYFEIGIKAGKFIEPIGLRTACAPAAIITAVASKL